MKRSGPEVFLFKLDYWRGDYWTRRLLWVTAHNSESVADVKLRAPHEARVVLLRGQSQAALPLTFSLHSVADCAHRSFVVEDGDLLGQTFLCGVDGRPCVISRQALGQDCDDPQHPARDPGICPEHPQRVGSLDARWQECREVGPILAQTPAGLAR